MRPLSLATDAAALVQSLRRDFNGAAAWAGVTTFIWYVVGLVPVQIAVTGQFGLDAHQISSWICIIWLTGAISSIGLSVLYRQPIPITSSIPGLIFMGTLAGRFSFPELVGANLMAGLLIALLGLFGISGRLLAWLPLPVAMGMLGGSLLADVTRVVSTTTEDAMVAGATVLGYFAGRAIRHPRIPPVSLALLGGGAAVFFAHRVAPAPVLFTLPDLVMPGIAFSPSAFIAVSLPMVVLSMGLGNVQGLGFLAGQGYRVPVNQTTIVLGLNSIVNALFGGHPAIVSRNGMPIMAGPEAGPVGGRYWANIVSAALALSIALAAGPVASLFGVLPRGYIVALAGIAILPSFQNALEKAVSGRLRFGAVVAFIVAATPFSWLGISSAFWAVAAGLAASAVAEPGELLLHWRRETDGGERRQEPRLPSVVVPTLARLVAGGQRTPIFASVSNFSTRGIQVRCRQRVLPGQQLEFHFAMPDGQAEVRLRADVRHVEPVGSHGADEWEAGCEFRDMSPGTHAQILNFLVEQQAAARLHASGAAPRHPSASASGTIIPELIASH